MLDTRRWTESKISTAWLADTVLASSARDYLQYLALTLIGIDPPLLIKSNPLSDWQPAKKVLREGAGRFDVGRNEH